MVISTKSGDTTVSGFWDDLHTSLRLLKTDYVDVYQFHNPDFCPKPDDGSGLYEAMLEAQRQGKVHYIGISNHRQKVALEAVESGLHQKQPLHQRRKNQDPRPRHPRRDEVPER